MKTLTVVIIALLMPFSSRSQGAYRQDERSMASMVIKANGGTAAFDSVNYIGWNFFGSRQIIWDKVHNRVRVDYLKKKVTIITELDSDTGKLFINGVESTHPDSLKKYMYKGKLIWMNDSYWLVMPFKLLDEGVNLKYIGMAKTIDRLDAYVLEMTFNSVGATPENKYHIYIDPKSYFVLQWDFYDSYTDSLPEFNNIWRDYKKYGPIYLSGDRGTEGVITDIHIWATLPESVFYSITIPPFSEL